MKNIHLAVILHDIRSVHNVGSIFRTADAVGAEKIYLCGITPSPIDRFKNIRADFAKVALGAEKNIGWESVGTTEGAIERMKRDGWKVFALEQAKNSIPYYSATLENKIALVLGNEVGGLPPSVLKMADAAIEIPMAGKKESLNVAVAFGIAVFGLKYGK